MYQHIKVPTSGQKIKVNSDFSLQVPDQPIIPFIEGDGTGADITPVMIKVVDAAVAKAYGGKKKIHWMEVLAGEKANNTLYGLSAGVWTDKGSRILEMVQRMKAGVVWANTFNRFDPTSPFGGYKESGFGREGGLHGLLAYVDTGDGH